MGAGRTRKYGSLGVNTDIQVIAPVSSGTPAPGTHKGFDKNQKQVIQRVFDLENLIR